jgi:hypothetical protein
MAGSRGRRGSRLQGSVTLFLSRKMVHCQVVETFVHIECHTLMPCDFWIRFQDETSSIPSRTDAPIQFG